MERIRGRRLDARGWGDVLERFGASALTVRAFCRVESISTASFYRWRARLGGTKAAAVVTPPRAVARKDAAAARFIELGALGAPRVGSSSRLELQLDLGGGLMLRLVRG